MTSSKSPIIIAAVLGFCLPLIFSAFYCLFQHHHQVSPAKATNSEITPTPSPTSVPTPTVAVSAIKNYKDTDYNFKVSFPSSWQGVLNQNTSLGLETYTIHSPDKSESLEILISNGIWADVKLELGAGSQKTSFLGGSCLLRKNGKTTVYIFPSKINGQIFRLSITGNSSQITKIFNSFKLI